MSHNKVNDGMENNKINKMCQSRRRVINLNCHLVYEICEEMEEKKMVFMMVR